MPPDRRFRRANAPPSPPSSLGPTMPSSLAAAGSETTRGNSDAVPPPSPAVSPPAAPTWNTDSRSPNAFPAAPAVSASPLQLRRHRLPWRADHSGRLDDWIRPRWTGRNRREQPGVPLSTASRLAIPRGPESLRGNRHRWSRWKSWRRPKSRWGRQRRFRPWSGTLGKSPLVGHCDRLCAPRDASGEFLATGNAGFRRITRLATRFAEAERRSQYHPGADARAGRGNWQRRAGFVCSGSYGENALHEAAIGDSAQWPGQCARWATRCADD